MNSTTSVIYGILEWITKFAYVNLLWIIFTLAGGIILGFYPSTIAMFTMVRDWLRGKTDLPVLKTFWKYYKRDFLKSNILGIFLNILLVFIIIDIYYIQINSNEQLTWSYIPLFGFMIIVALFLFYLFPSFVHFDLKIGQLMKNAFLIMMVSPIQSFLIVISLISVFLIMRAIPALFFIFGATTYAFITTWLGLHAFNRIQRKHENM